MNGSTTSKEFSTEPSLRTKHVSILFLKLLLPMCAAYAGVRLTAGRPLLPVPVYLLLIALVVPPTLCYGRTIWGSAIRFDEHGIRFLRKGKTIQHIPRSSIESLRCKSNSISFRYTADATSKAMVIGNEGFSRATWQEMRNYFNDYITNDGNA
jgi:hypothetical protein